LLWPGVQINIGRTSCDKLSLPVPFYLTFDFCFGLWKISVGAATIMRLADTGYGDDGEADGYSEEYCSIVLYRHGTTVLLNMSAQEVRSRSTSDTQT
jgi:hypothetical protein